MKSSIKKVFWKSVSVKKMDDNYLIYLDNVLLKTPSRITLKLPNKKLADIIASEWSKQKNEIDYSCMIANHLVNMAMDKIANESAETKRLLSDYAETDLLYYRSEQPKELIDKQTLLWDPILDWVETRFDVSLNITTGVIPIRQPKKSLDHLTSQMNNMDIFLLSGFYQLVTLSGSYILGLAALESFMDCQKIWDAAILDDDWQTSLWGEDEEQTRNLNFKKKTFFKTIEVCHALY